MQFDARALGANHHIVVSTLEALDVDHATALLQAQGLVPLSVKPRRGSGRQNWLRARWKKPI